MATNSTDLLTLIELCSEKELKTNLNILKYDFQFSDSSVSWLPLLAKQFETYNNITTLNLYEKISMLVEVRKLIPKLLELNTDLTTIVKSTETICRQYNFNFHLNLTENLLMHRSSCKSCKTVEKETEDLTGETNEFFEIYYPSRIVNFVQSLDKCYVSTVRVQPNGIVECLLCDCRVSETHLANLKEHILGKRHLQKVGGNYRHLVAFHKFWRRQKSEIWRRHFQFKCVPDGLRCVVCDTYVEYKGVVAHLDRCREPLTQQGPNIITQTLTAVCSTMFKESSLQETPRGLYPISIEKLLFSDVPFIQLGENFYPVFQCKTSQHIFCLICNGTVSGDQGVHVDSGEHVALQDSEEVQASLRLYHDVWSSLSESVQKLQVYFVRGPRTMTCTICEFGIDYDGDVVMEHVSSKDHGKCMEYKRMRDREVVGSSKEVTKPNHFNKVYTSLYRDVPSITVANKSYPIFQRNEVATGITEFICMICNENVGTLSDRDRHEKTASHVLWQGEKHVRESLARFHEVWGALSLGKQFKQTQFERRPTKMKCKICRDCFVDYDVASLMGHLTSEQHAMKKQRTRPRKRRRRKTGGVAGDDSTNKSSESIQESTSPQLSVSESSSVIALGDSTNKSTESIQGSKSSQRSVSESSSVIALEIPDVFVVISDSEEPDLHANEPLAKKSRTDDEPAEETTSDFVEAKKAPGYIYYNSNWPDFIPLTMNSPELTSELASNTMTEKTEPSSSNNGTKEDDAFHQEQLDSSR